MYYNKETVIYHQGNFVKATEAHSSLYSQTLHYGNGVFEGIRSYNTPEGTKVFKAKEHYERFLYGINVMNIPFERSVEELIAITYELLEKNNLTDAYIRPIVSCGDNMGLLGSTQSFLTIQCWEWARLMGDELLKVRTSSFERPNPKSCFVDAKVNGHYVNSILSKNEAKNTGFDEALLLDINGYVAESSGANVFMEKDGKLVTPPKGNILPGITRNTVIELCQENNIPIEERLFTLEEFKQADSAFFTGTAAEVVGVGSIDDYVFPLAWERSQGHKLMHLYKETVLDLRIPVLKN